MLSARTQTLVALLASDNDGEALNAARKLKAALAAEGLDFHDLARGVGRPADAKPERPKRRGWRDDLNALIALGEDVFGSREWDFLQSMADWNGSPTERQAQWLNKLKARELADG
jgi:hypothetical protein